MTENNGNKKVSETARYEQMVSIYGTIAIEAKNEKEAKNKIDKIIWALKDNECFDHEKLIVGDIERESDIKRCD